MFNNGKHYCDKCHAKIIENIDEKIGVVISISAFDFKNETDIFSKSIELCDTCYNDFISAMNEFEYPVLSSRI